VAQIRVSTEKVVKRGERIEALDFEEAEPVARAGLLPLQARGLRAVE
jgi:DNA recombination protein RmuC